MPNFELALLLKATWETLYIVFISSLISLLLGSFIGTLLFLTREKQAFENSWLHQLLSLIVNVTRSVPFIILMISIIPLTRFLVGTTIGSNAAIVPLALAAIPFYARICENAFTELSPGLLETAHSLGVTTTQLIFKILIPESLPSLIRGFSLTVIALIGYSAMAGTVGGGGLGELAINYGYQRFDALITLETVVILILIVQIVQATFDFLAKRRRLQPLLLIGLIFGLFCLGSQGYSLFSSREDTLSVGITPGWSEEVMKEAQKVAWKEYHLKLKLVTFNDYVLPNTALASGNIDSNIFQHLPYLQAQMKARGYKLTAIAKTFVYPMGFYSAKLSELKYLQAGALIALPNDPSNEGRSLLLLQKAGLITLKPQAGTLAALKDISSNPQHFQFKLLDAAQLPRVLKDADLVALTNDYVGAAGFKTAQALFKEGPDSLYANIIVVREKDQANPLFQKLIAVMHSPPVTAKTEALFPGGGAIPAWQERNKTAHS
ncbi:MAG TPA: MetQ/NlpA family ABC transporter substrate-binding protein [Gammaproteobacteria bacterium]|nr:MetQ/NlpA family ABC transporter substrate-binding protein [Gammaproteobacteria bacterium]